MVRKVLMGWILAFLAVISFIVEAVVTLVQSLKAHTFVWPDANWYWLWITIAVFAIGVILFITRAFKAVEEF